MGRAAFFIRTFGCPVRCSWCDAAGTWHPDYRPKDGVSRLLPGELAGEAWQSGCEIVVITGGEPAVHDLSALTRHLQCAGLRVHIETCGAYELKGDFDWVTISPKREAPVLDENLNKASEWKLIIETPDDIYYWMDTTLRHWPHLHHAPVWLHPEWSKREDPKVLKAIVEAVKGRPKAFRAGWQLHKLYTADLFDKRSRQPVPLGGNPKLGY